MFFFLFCLCKYRNILDVKIYYHTIYYHTILRVQSQVLVFVLVLTLCAFNFQYKMFCPNVAVFFSHSLIFTHIQQNHVMTYYILIFGSILHATFLHLILPAFAKICSHVKEKQYIRTKCRIPTSIWFYKTITRNSL